MPESLSGTLLECDEACMVTVENLNREEERKFGQGFIILKIDPNRCLVKNDKVDLIRSQVRQRMDHAMGKDDEKDDIDCDLDEKSKYV